MPEDYFLDNDVILKLTAFGLMQSVLNKWSVDFKNIFVLKTARYQLAGNSVRVKYSPDVSERSTHFAVQCQSVPTMNLIGDSIALAELDLLKQVLDIDIGESQLLVETRNSTSFELVTGDKKFLRALVQHNQLSHIRERVQGKVRCLEQIVLDCINDNGFDWVKNQVVSVSDTKVDQAIQCCFGSGSQANEQTVTDALNAYIHDLRSQTCNLLVIP
ncbi:MAG: hypothetical protein AAF268_11835 [Cyanobacteria bacterium P01_A01_bin.3]